MIKNFTIQRISDHNGEGNKPTHKLSAKIGESYKTIGKAWTKDGQYGKYLSAALDNVYENGEKFYDGYVIISETEYNELISLKSSSKEVNDLTPENHPLPGSNKIPGTDIDYPVNDLGEQIF